MGHHAPTLPLDFDDCTSLSPVSTRRGSGHKFEDNSPTVKPGAILRMTVWEHYPEVFGEDWLNPAPLEEVTDGEYAGGEYHEFVNRKYMRTVVVLKTSDEDNSFWYLKIRDLSAAGIKHVSRSSHFKYQIVPLACSSEPETDKSIYGELKFRHVPCRILKCSGESMDGRVIEMDLARWGGVTSVCGDPVVMGEIDEESLDNLYRLHEGLFPGMLDPRDWSLSDFGGNDYTIAERIMNRFRRFKAKFAHKCDGCC